MRNIVLLLITLILLLNLTACVSSRELAQPTRKTTSLFLEGTICFNAMPMTTSKPSISVKICPGMAVFEEDLKINSLLVEGEKGVWETSTFDRNVMEGKGFTEISVYARNVDESIGPIKNVSVAVEFACGKKDTLMVPQLKTLVAY